MDKIAEAVDSLLQSKVDQMVDLGISMMGDNKDNVGKVMDKLLSSRGGELEDSEWEEVEQELEDFRSSLGD